MMPQEVRAAVSAIVAATPIGAAWQLEDTDAFRESDFPLVPEHAPDMVAHLVFWVDDRDALQGEPLGQQADNTDSILVASPLVVRFLYQVQPQDRAADWDRAGRAAVAVLRELMAADTWELNLTLDSRVFRRFFGESPDWVIVEVFIRATYTLSLASEAS